MRSSLCCSISPQQLRKAQGDPMSVNWKSWSRRTKWCRQNTSRENLNLDIHQRQLAIRHPLGLPKYWARSQSTCPSLIHDPNVCWGQSCFHTGRSPWCRTWRQWICCVQLGDSHSGNLLSPAQLWSLPPLGNRPEHALSRELQRGLQPSNRQGTSGVVLYQVLELCGQERADPSSIRRAPVKRVKKTNVKKGKRFWKILKKSRLSSNLVQLLSLDILPLGEKEKYSISINTLKTWQ